MDNRENTRTVKEFLTTHAGASFSMMTPGGYVDLTAEQAERLLEGQGAVAHPGVAGITMTLSYDELLGQIVDSSNWKDGVWYLMTHAPAMKQCESETNRHFAMQENGASPENQWRTFLDHLQGKEVTYKSEPQYLTGSRTLRAEDISFAGDIVLNGHLLEFYMESIFDADAVFGTNVCTTENDDWLNAYANYDLERGCVCDTLIVDLVFTDGSEQECRYRLSPEEQALLLPKMDAYCQKQLGQGLEQCRADYVAEQKLVPSELQM